MVLSRLLEGSNTKQIFTIGTLLGVPYIPYSRDSGYLHGLFEVSRSLLLDTCHTHAIQYLCELRKGRLGNEGRGIEHDNRRVKEGKVST